MADLVVFTESDTSRDGFFILALMVGFLGFVYCRGKNDKGRQLEDNLRLRIDVPGHKELEAE